MCGVRVSLPSLFFPLSFLFLILEFHIADLDLNVDGMKIREWGFDSRSPIY